MLLGDILARFDDESLAAETLLGLGDLALVARLTKEAQAQGRSLGEVNSGIQQAIAGMSLPAGYRFSSGGEVRDQQRVFSRMLAAMGIAVMLMYLILVVQFGGFLEPLAIMASLPLSLIGVVLALLLTHDTLNIMSMIGVLMLMGIVAKNAILLIDFAIEMRVRGMDRIAAVIEAGKWIDASLSNRQKTAETVADKSYVNTDKDVILARMLGRYDNGIGKTWDDPNAMKFYNDGAVNFPYLSDGMWFLTQHRRWGLLKQDPDYLAVAKQINRIDIYKQAATAAKANVPKDPMRTSKFMDGVVWDGKNPAQYAGGFKIKVA